MFKCIREHIANRINYLISISFTCQFRICLRIFHVDSCVFVARPLFGCDIWVRVSCERKRGKISDCNDRDMICNEVI